VAQDTEKRHSRQYLKREMPQSRSYSAAVVTQGGRTIWLAGVVAAEDRAGQSLAGDFDGQVREVFARIGNELEAVGATLANLVTMTVFITDTRYGDRFVQLRKEILGDNFPASALITCAGLGRPGLLVEIQAIAVSD
jgi:2-iminobutanoate/2-iminopropanoate deaminase